MEAQILRFFISNIHLEKYTHFSQLNCSFKQQILRFSIKNTHFSRQMLRFFINTIPAHLKQQILRFFISNILIFKDKCSDFSSTLLIFTKQLQNKCLLFVYYIICFIRQILTFCISTTYLRGKSSHFSSAPPISETKCSFFPFFSS